MAVKLIANYAKRLGLPGYSSHQFSLSIETELQNLDNVREESAHLYNSLQNAVDQQIQKTGFVPPDGYGMKVEKNGVWNCSQKQRELIVQVRVYGNTAVETGRSTMIGQDKGQTVSRDTRFTQVWVKQQGRWRVVANHYSTQTKRQ